MVPRQATATRQFWRTSGSSFDQFEEFFSYPAAEQEQFKRELAELLYSDIPQPLRKRLSELAPEAKRQLAQPMQVKAARYPRDRISLLDSMTDALPAICTNGMS